ncbi:MAG: orotidine-5'-phosphate decarboxylase [Saprospiraceae bacterium]
MDINQATNQKDRKMAQHWGDLVQEKTQQYGQLCVGIDPVLADIPHAFKEGGKEPLEVLSNYVHFVLDTVSADVGFIKPQSAFYEAFGSGGVAIMADLFAKAKSRGLGIILDAKRGDIGSTADAYARAYLTPKSAGGSDLEVDCITINPFLGPETLEPFVECAKKYGKGVFFLAKTSNPGAGWLQDQMIEGQTVSDRVSRLISGWAEETKGQSGLSAVGAVVGITFPEDARRLRQMMPNSIFLAPGLGPQGGNLEDVVALQRPDGQGVVVPMSRGITMPEDLHVSLEDYADLISQRVQHIKLSLTAAAANTLKKDNGPEYGTPGL